MRLTDETLRLIVAELRPPDGLSQNYRSAGDRAYIRVWAQRDHSICVDVEFPPYDVRHSLDKVTWLQGLRVRLAEAYAKFKSPTEECWAHLYPEMAE